MNKSNNGFQKMNDPKDQLPGGKNLVLAAIFGVGFGFLLQKGGVAKFNVLIGQLLLQDWTVLKVMMTAVVVGMIGVFPLHYFGKAKLHLQPTRLGANIIGGAIFGVGFALLAYCPGTGAAALGQGNWDAAFGVLGLMAGSYLFAELSERLGETVGKWGDKGRLMLPDLVRAPHGAFVLGFALLLTAGLILLQRTFPR